MARGELRECGISRREFLRWAAAAGLALPVLGGLGELLPALAAAEVKKNVADGLRFSTRPQGWKGLFGFITFRLHPVFFNGQHAYHIRTDASDAAFARRVGLVHVPKLVAALRVGLTGDYYHFAGSAAAGQHPVVSVIPGRADYTPCFRLSRVSFTRSPRLLTSVEAVRDAEARGVIQIEATTIAVNYPIVKWPDGELPHDAVRTAYLGDGQLLERPNADNRTVTFKLHQCFPGAWYIVTDTSAAPMAPMMRIAASPRTQGLTTAAATAEILVFGNGIPGPGPMGFQPSIFDSLPGNPVWSPFWDHFTFAWVEGRPSVVRDQGKLLDLERAGRLKRWPGTPDTKGELFVVNCPSPVTAPMTWTG